MKPAEVMNFVETLSRKSSPKEPKKEIAKLRGIWKGFGFEKLDIEKEIRSMRKEFDEAFLRWIEGWNK
jgi:hypothetical protein